MKGCALNYSRATTRRVASNWKRSIGLRRWPRTAHSRILQAYGWAGLGLAALVSLPMSLFAPELLRLSGASAGVVALGTDYLRLSALALAPSVLGAVLSGVMRSLGHARSPMVATFLTVILNTLLQYGYDVLTGRPAPPDEEPLVEAS